MQLKKGKAPIGMKSDSIIIVNVHWYYLLVMFWISIPIQMLLLMVLMVAKAGRKNSPSRCEEEYIKCKCMSFQLLQRLGQTWHEYIIHWSIIQMLRKVRIIQVCNTIFQHALCNQKVLNSNTNKDNSWTSSTVVCNVVVSPSGWGVRIQNMVGTNQILK